MLTLYDRTVRVLRTSELEGLKLQIPHIQRIRHNTKVKSIVAYQLVELKRHGRAYM